MAHATKRLVCRALAMLLLAPLMLQAQLPVLKDEPAQIAKPLARVYRVEQVVDGVQLSYDSHWVIRDTYTGRFSRVQVDPKLKRHEPIVDSTVLSIRETWKATGLDLKMASDVIVDRKQPFFLIKATSSAQEAAGTVHQQVNHLGQVWKYWWDSHWEGEGFGERLLGKRVLCDLQLALALPRVQWTQGYQFDLPMVWDLKSRHANASSRQMVNFQCVGEAEVSVPAGIFRCWQIQACSGDRKLRIDLSQENSNLIVRMVDSGPTQLKLELKQHVSQQAP